MRFAHGTLCGDEVRSEAWLQATELALERGHALDLDDPADAAVLLRRVRLHSERAQRRARTTCSLDQPLGHDASGPTLLDVLQADDGAHPASLLDEPQDAGAAPAPEAPEPAHSEVAAWHWLVLRFDRRMAELAALLISTSWCRQRRRRARHRATAQWPLIHRLGVDPHEQADALQPWRRFKLPPRRPAAAVQMTLDYWTRPAQPERGQLWLL